MRVKSGQHALFLRSSSCTRTAVAGSKHLLQTRLSKCGATGGESSRPQRDVHRGEATAKHGERFSTGAADAVNPKREASHEDNVRDVRQSSGGGASDASIQAANVQVCDRLKNNTGEPYVEDSVLDVAYEILEDGSPPQTHQVWHTRCTCVLCTGSVDIMRQSLDRFIRTSCTH